MSEPLKEIRTSRVRLIACVGVQLVARVASGLAAESGAPSRSSNQIWDSLETSQIRADTKSGSIRIEHTAATRALDGERLTISGTVVWREEAEQPMRFAMTRMASGCPACDLGDPTKIINVYSTQLAPEMGTETIVSGLFSIGDAQKDVWVFNLADTGAAQSH